MRSLRLLLLALALPLGQCMRTNDHISLDVSTNETQALDNKQCALGNKQRYVASLLYAVADAAVKKGADLIIDRKKAGDGKSMPGGDWSSTYLETIARGWRAPKCLLFVDLGGGSLTGELFGLEKPPTGQPQYKMVEGAQRYKSTDHTEVEVPGLSGAYDAKGTFNDYSGKKGEELRKHAALLTKHMKLAYETSYCDEEKHLAEELFIRQTGKIRYVELSKPPKDQVWEGMTKTELESSLSGTKGPKVDYALLPGETEAKYEGVSFWEHNFAKFSSACEDTAADPAPTKANLLLMQVGSSSTQASTCLSATCGEENVMAAGHGILGAIPSEEQLARACVEGQNCYPELIERVMSVLQGAGIDRLATEHRSIALLNAIGYRVKDMYEECQGRPAESVESLQTLTAACKGIQDQVSRGGRVSAANLREVAAWLGGFPLTA